jgi:molybdate transport system substrate-binding protein
MDLAKALIAFLTLAHGLSAQAPVAKLTVAAAASVQYAMEDLKADFRKASGIDMNAVYGSSGKLCAQIRNGAPFDVFVSADMDFPDSLVRWGYALEKAEPYAYGKLVLWTSKRINLEKGLAILADTGLGKIAVADPQRAPYGREAVKAIRHSGTWAAAEPRLVFGESISQVNQYILLGSAGIGITAKSTVLAAEMKGKGTWKEVDSAAYDPIAQGAVICKHGVGAHPAESARFLAYLYSGPARAILARYGYGLP